MLQYFSGLIGVSWVTGSGFIALLTYLTVITVASSVSSKLPTSHFSKSPSRLSSRDLMQLVESNSYLKSKTSSY